MARWSEEIIGALDVPDVERRVRLVRYEDLVADRRKVLGQIVEFLALPPLTASAAELDRTPVRGSSDLGGRGTIHWRPVTMGDDFSPVEPYRRWSASELHEADLLLGPELEAFGYARASPQSLADPASRMVLHARHVAVSGGESARVRLRRARRRFVERR